MIDEKYIDLKNNAEIINNLKQIIELKDQEIKYLKLELESTKEQKDHLRTQLTNIISLLNNNKTIQFNPSLINFDNTKAFKTIEKNTNTTNLSKIKNNLKVNYNKYKNLKLDLNLNKKLNYNLRCEKILKKSYNTTNNKNTPKYGNNITNIKQTIKKILSTDNIDNINKLKIN